MRFTRLIITAADEYWLQQAVREFTGFSSSVIACDLECGVERWLPSGETLDGRPGASVLAFGFSSDALQSAVPNRSGQCVMTCPTTALFNGLLDVDESIALGKHVRFFGDGFQKSKLLGNRRFWRIPVMDGEFLIEDRAGVGAGVGGGNILVQAVDVPAALDAVRRGTAAIRELDGVIMPFPGGVARSGSKVGSRYKMLKASTAEAYCPTLRGRVESKLHDGAGCVLEIVIDGVSEAAVAAAMRVAATAAAGDGVVAISAGNYGGKLGKYHFSLHDLLQ